MSEIDTPVNEYVEFWNEILANKLAKGFTFTIMDVSYTEGDRVIELNAPEDLYDIAALLRDPERYVIESVRSRATGDIAAVDVCDHPFWDSVRERVSQKAMEMSRQGFFGNAMLPMAELEYTGVANRLDTLNERFQVRRE